MIKQTNTVGPPLFKQLLLLRIIIFFQFGTGGNAQEGQACSKCAHLSHTREPIRIKWDRTL